MVSISQEIELYCKDRPQLLHGISHGYINYTGLAQYLAPLLEEKLFKKVSTGSIVMALHRVAKQQNGIYNKPEVVIEDISMHFPLTEISYLYSPDTAHITSKVYEKFGPQKQSYLNVVVGQNQISILINSKHITEVKEMFYMYEPHFEESDLGSLSLTLDYENWNRVGVAYHILDALFARSITIAEVISGHSEVMISMKKEYIHEAFTVLSDRFIQHN